MEFGTKKSCELVIVHGKIGSRMLEMKRDHPRVASTPRLGEQMISVLLCQ